MTPAEDVVPRSLGSFCADFFLKHDTDVIKCLFMFLITVPPLGSRGLQRDTCRSLIICRFPSCGADFAEMAQPVKAGLLKHWTGQCEPALRPPNKAPSVWNRTRPSHPPDEARRRIRFGGGGPERCGGGPAAEPGLPEKMGHDQSGLSVPGAQGSLETIHCLQDVCSVRGLC